MPQSRLKVTAPDLEVMELLMDYLTQSFRETVKLVNPRRRIISVEGLPDSAIDRLKVLGAEVVEEFRFDLD